MNEPIDTYGNAANSASSYQTVTDHGCRLDLSCTVHYVSLERCGVAA